MEKLYKDEYVECIDYDLFREELCKGTIKVDISDIKKYICYQHAIIKFLETSRPNTMVFKILAKMYDDFYNYPHLFAMSPLLYDQVIEKYADQLEKNKIKSTIDNYYNNSVMSILTDEFFKRELNQEEKNKFFSFLIRDMKTNNSYNYKKVLKSVVDKKRSPKELSDIELQFIGQYVASYCNKNIETYITSEHPSITSCDTKGLITINKNAKDLKDIEDFIYAAACAGRFARAENVANLDVIQQYELAIHLLFNKYLNESDYVLYNKEYICSSIYSYSIDKGYFDAQVLLSTLGNEELADELLKDKMNNPIIKNNRIYHSNSSYRPLMLNKDEEMIPGEFPASLFITKHLDEILLNHPNELKNYPVLNKFYNEYGKRKSFKELLKSYEIEPKTQSSIYSNFISQDINDGELNKYDLPTNYEDIYNHFKSLSSIFHDKMMNLYIYLRSNNNTNKEELGYSILYQINQLASILNYVINNIDLLITVIKEKGNIDQGCLLYKFLSDFKEFDYNSITNEAIINNQYVMYALIQLEVIHAELNGIFNRAYIDNKVDGLSDDEREKEIELNDGKTINLVDFLYQEVLPNINNSLEYVKDDKTISVNTLIDGYKKGRSTIKKH